jgi:hypothetical protein
MGIPRPQATNVQARTMRESILDFLRIKLRPGWTLDE